MASVTVSMQTLNAAIQWGDASCWSGWQTYELCCYPRRETHRTKDELHVQVNGFTPCWDEARNVSRCCRPRGSSFRMSHSLPPTLKNLLAGCDAPQWQNFLFKVRITAGVMWAVDANEAAWFQYPGHPMARRKVTAPCAAGMAMHRLLWDYLSLDVSPDALKALSLLEYVDAELRPWGGLFHAFGMTLEQFRFIRSLQLVQNFHTGRPIRGKFRTRKYISENPSAQLSARPLAFDLGASGGLDAEFYLYSGLKVVAVEGNVKALQALRSRLMLFAERGNLTLINAVAGASSAPEIAEFKIDHHQPEISGLFDDSKPIKDASVHRVPRRACGALYAQFARRKRPEYVKIDLEGLDLPCLVSLLRNTTMPDHRFTPRRVWKSALNSTRKFRPAAPRFLSLELNLRHSSNIILQKALETAEMLRGLLQGRYCDAKLCRQHIYNIRYVEKLGVLSRIGLGSSGLFGNAAVDWRVGEAWRPLETVLAELPQAGMLALLAMEWFDLHLRHC